MRKIVVDRLARRAPLRLRQVGRQRGRGRVGVHRRRLERPFDEIRGRQRAGDEGKIPADLFAAVAVDLVARETMRFRGCEAGLERGTEPRRMQRGVAPLGPYYLVWHNRARTKVKLPL